MDISEKDLQLKLLSKNPIYVDKIPIYSVSIEEITEYGYDRYFQSLQLFCITKEKVEEYFINDEFLKDKFEEINGVHIYSFLSFYMSNNEEIRNDILDILSFLCKASTDFSEDTGIISINNIEINIDILLKMQLILRKRNNLTILKEDLDNPADEKTRLLLEQRKKYRQKINQTHNGADELTLGDLVSIFASESKQSLDYVMKYDLYQFNDQFNRLCINNNYEVDIQALMHGAKSEDIELQHWMCKIEN